MILYDLTLAQKSLIELKQFYKDTSISVLCGAIILDKHKDREILMEAAGLVLRKHQAMRLCFVEQDGAVKQYVNEEYKEPVFEQFGSLDEMRDYADKLARVPHAIDGSFMYEMVVFEAEGRSGVILSTCHLISDAWSFSVIASDFIEFCGKIENGEEIDIVEQLYTDRLANEEDYVSSGKYARDEAYWLERYGNCTEKTIVRNSGNAGSIEASRFVTHLGKEMKERIDSFLTENKISLTTLTETAVLIYLDRINPDNKSTTIGVPVLGRISRYEKSTAGVYISTIPLTVDIDGGLSVLDLLHEVSASHHKIYRHKRFSYNALLKKLRGNGGKDCGTGLFDVLVSCQNARIKGCATTEWFHNGYSELPLSIHIENRDQSDRYTIIYDFQNSVFKDRKEIELLSRRIEFIIDEMITAPTGKISGISILPEAEKEFLINLNDTTCTVSDTSVSEVLSRVAKANADRTALVYKDKRYTYEQLDLMSDMLAWKLAKEGIGPGRIVPIKAFRTPYMIIAMLAVIKTGAAYMFISPSFPETRINYMLEASGAADILTADPNGDASFELTSQELLEYNGFTPVKVNADDPCYVVFTSGSTGNPKGTAVTHGNILNYCMNSPFNVMGRIIKNNDSGIVSVTDNVFDIFVTESILALLNCITIYLASDEEAVSQKKLSALIERENIGIIQTTPTKMRGYMLDRSNVEYLKKLHTIILGGEELSRELCAQLQELTSADIYNVYGPVETTVWSTIAPAYDGDTTVGTPIANTQIYITDDDLNMLPAGVIGEICIGGAGVSKGYINNADLNKSRFVEDPFREGSRIYRTGDMGLLRADGLIDFCGRRDNQIKLRGLRIELGEIENALLTVRGIELAAVKCVDGANGSRILAAYYTASSPLDEKNLRTYLAGLLPRYMVPNVFVKLDSMPMTASGKISRKELPAPDLTRASLFETQREYEAPSGENERILCDIFGEVLHLDKVGVTEDFFELGGDSFGAMEIVSLAGNRGITISVNDIYKKRTVRAICAALGDGEKDKKATSEDYPRKRNWTDRFLLACFSGFTRLLTRFSSAGAEEIARYPKAILCPNHESDLDALLVLSALKKNIDISRLVTIMASERGSDGIERKAFRVCGGIPIDREGDFMLALNRATALLSDSHDYLLIFPEGTRSRTGELGDFKQGAAMISKETGIPIIPVCIRGTGKAMPVGKKCPKYLNPFKLKKYALTVSFGESIYPSGKSVEEITSSLRACVAGMLK
ncbi:MAG: amino acid adenylation domain-containing protein [Saccharofermentans sp.]|nr:amino acid adenylation domain-containing protein [Saccharofermentans sp.]